jgi:hypothetical protein
MRGSNLRNVYLRYIKISTKPNPFVQIFKACPSEERDLAPPGGPSETIKKDMKLLSK